MTEHERNRLGLPKNCECGGTMIYDVDFGRVWSVCDTCTPVVNVKVPDHSTLSGRKKALLDPSWCGRRLLDRWNNEYSACPRSPMAWAVQDTQTTRS